MTAVIYGIDHFRSYLWGTKFTVYTDNTAVTDLARQEKTTNKKAFKWFTLLHEYDFDIKHRDGQSLKHVDALSRYPPKLGTVNYLAPTWQAADFEPIFDLEHWKASHAKVTLPHDEKFTRDDGLWYRRTEDGQFLLYVPEDLRSEVLKMYHDSPSMGHGGYKRMLSKIRQKLFWPAMSKDIAAYVQSCDKCQRGKFSNRRVPQAGRPVPSTCLEQVSVDLVGKLPPSGKGYIYVLCVQDRFSRFLAFIPLKDKSAPVVARAFLNDWVCKYGAPSIIVSDRGTEFMAEIFKVLAKFLGAKHAPTAAYRPQGNAENERSHQDLHTFLTMFLEESEDGWHSLLSYAAWCHNSAVHSVLGKSPIEVLTGIPPRDFPSFLPRKNQEEHEERLEYFFAKREKDLMDLRNNTRLAIEKSQAMAMERANEHARVQSYAVGQQVLVRQRLVNYAGRKWGEKYKGPYIIKAVVSPQIVLVSLPDDPQYTDYVHTSYIRPYLQRVVENDSEKEEESIEPLGRSKVPFPTAQPKERDCDSEDACDDRNITSEEVDRSKVRHAPRRVASASEARIVAPRRVTVDKNLSESRQVMPRVPKMQSDALESTRDLRRDLLKTPKQSQTDERPSDIEGASASTAMTPFRQMAETKAIRKELFQPSISPMAETRGARRRLFQTPTDDDEDDRERSFLSPYSHEQRDLGNLTAPRASYYSPRMMSPLPVTPIPRNLGISVRTTPDGYDIMRADESFEQDSAGKTTRTIEHRLTSDSEITVSKPPYLARASMARAAVPAKPSVRTELQRLIGDKPPEIKGGLNESRVTTRSQMPQPRQLRQPVQGNRDPDLDSAVPRDAPLPKLKSKRTAAQKAASVLQATKAAWAGRYKKDNY